MRPVRATEQVSDLFILELVEIRIVFPDCAKVVGFCKKDGFVAHSARPYGSEHAVIWSGKESHRRRSLRERG